MRKDSKRSRRSVRQQRARRWAARLLMSALFFLPVAIPAAATEGPATLEEAVAQVEQRQDGRILSARSEQRDGRVVYVIRVLTPRQQVRDLEIVGAEGARP